MAEPANNGNPASTSEGLPATSGGAPNVEDAALLKQQLADAQAALAKRDLRVKELSDENGKYRTRNDEETKVAKAAKAEAERKLAELGDFPKLLELERQKRTELETQVQALSPKAEAADRFAKRRLEQLEAAKAKGDLPAYLLKAIDNAAARDVEDAHEILEGYRESLPTTGKPIAANPAPSPGAAPASPSVRKGIEAMSEAEIHALRTSQPDEYRRLIGSPTANGSQFNPVTWMDSRRG